MARGLSINIKTSEFKGLLTGLKATWGIKALTKEAAAVAEELIVKAIESPVPTDTGELAGSGVVESNASAGTVRLGFNKVYAAFQDSPVKNVQTISPKRKKALFIPISARGRKHRF